MVDSRKTKLARLLRSAVLPHDGERGSRLLGLAVVLTLACSACGAGVKTLRADGVTWTEVAPPSFLFITDLSAARAVRHAREFEHRLNGLQSFIGAPAARGEKIRVVYLRSEREMAALSHKLVRGFYVPRSMHLPLLVTYDGADPQQGHTVNHELAHHIA